MKLAVIIGVLHMFMGVCLKLVNSLHFGKTLDILYEFIPQAIFLLALFGYMDLLIILKWLTNYEGRLSEAPNIITAIINMFIGFGKTTNLVFEGQQYVNFLMLALVVLCVPAMLIPKPLLLKKQYLLKHKDEQQIDELQVNEDLVAFKNSVLILKPKEEEFSFSEVFVHQLIETIEYALGTISNTASYLRLWALSLAHSELSEVFLNYAIILILKLPIPGFLKTYMLPFMVLLMLTMIIANVYVRNAGVCYIRNSAWNGCDGMLPAHIETSLG